jgi:hypothetical protein
VPSHPRLAPAGVARSLVLKPHLVLSLIVAVLCAVAPASLAQIDRTRNTPVGWGWIYAASPAAIDAQLAAGSRPIAFQRVAPSQYDTVFVVNSGSYAVSGADVLLNQSAANLASALALTGKRIVDLEPYDIGNGPVFNAIVVANSGVTIATGWQWTHGKTFSEINSWLAANPGLRLVDLDYYETNGTFRYSAVAVPNTGNNFQAATWYASNVTEDDIEDALQANDGRLIDIELISAVSGQAARFAYIMVPQNGVRSDFFPDASSSDIPALIEQYAGRIVCLERYEHFGSTRYAVVLTNNADSLTGRMRDYLAGNNGEDAGLFSDSNFVGGAMGFMLKEVGGPVITTVNPNFIWEPASTYKLLHAAYAIWQCSIGFDALTADVLYRNLWSVNQPESGCTSCPFTWTCAPLYIDLRETLRLLLEPSNNNALIALERRYNVADINNFADTRGFGAITSIRQDCDCAVVLNTATCTDICEMLEQVADGSIFNQSWQDIYYSLMIDLDEQGFDYYPVLNDIITQEAANTDLTPGERNAFRAAMRFANKGGSYDCGEVYRTEGAWASVPFKAYAFDQWITYAKEYVMAIFIHDSNNTNGSNVVYDAKQEILREQIRAALLSWDAACSTPFVFNPPDDISRVQGQDATFSALISGGGDGAAYQWQKLVGGNWFPLTNSPGNISGVTTNTLTIFTVETLNAGDYRLVYTSVCGSTTSITATLTVTVPPSCPGDADGNGSVTFLDITTVLANFGNVYTPSSGPGDADGNGAVAFLDITTVLANFGSICR